MTPSESKMQSRIWTRIRFVIQIRQKSTEWNNSGSRSATLKKIKVCVPLSHCRESCWKIPELYVNLSASVICESVGHAELGRLPIDPAPAN
jgi:hypothetical protein